MGFHIIILKKDSGIDHRYIRHLEDLAHISELQKDSIIYEGEEHWTPSLVGSNERYTRYTEEQYRAGMKAQRLFLDQAVKKGYMVEPLNQDKESFKAYINVAQNWIKRGDFLIRNAGNTEVEVKCRTFHGKGERRFFYLSQDDLHGHLNMSASTRAPVILAIYEQNGDNVKEDTLIMCDVGSLEEKMDQLDTSAKDDNPTYKIPLSYTTKGFAILDDHKKKL